MGPGLTSEPPPRLSGTRPAGARDEREASARVQGMFSQIAPRYDFLNHFLSFSLDHVWRRRTARKFRHIVRQTDSRVLDLCCGTGDMTFALEKTRMRALRDRGAHRFPLVGSDFAQPMLDRAHRKAAAHTKGAVFATADAMNLPFANNSFDLVTTAFGFRNLVNYEAGLREIARVLQPGGQLGILEFSEPASGVMAALFRFYFKFILPVIGGVISGSGEAYRYLPKSVSRFPGPAALAKLMEKVGFERVEIASWNFGSVVLHSARLPKAPDESM
jgi:demethylmenaquinone methyltransferase/2-methoxy-6-polyprenyl-1,4-benzoquinol methylase